MAYPTLLEIQHVPEPAPNWMWTLDMLLPDNTFIDRMRVLEVNFPFSYIDTMQRYRQGSYVYFPGHSNIDGVNVTFLETGNFDVLPIIKSWQSKVKNSATGNYGIAKDYLGSAVLRNYDVKGKLQMTHELFGCWPTRLSDWSMNYQGSNHLMVQVQFSVNDSESNHN